MSAPATTGTGTVPGDAAVGGKRRSAWMSHVKKTMRANKGKSLSQVLKMAKKTYKKTRRGGGGDEAENKEVVLGGGVAETASPVGGRRRRGSRKSKKGSRRH